jgi:hypothetical protein
MIQASEKYPTADPNFKYLIKLNRSDRVMSNDWRRNISDRYITYVHRPM